MDLDLTGKKEEFVAHSASVNCLKIGRKTSRVLVTGGEDHAVNLWAIGKPNPVQVIFSSCFCLFYNWYALILLGRLETVFIKLGIDSNGIRLCAMTIICNASGILFKNEFSCQIQV